METRKRGGPAYRATRFLIRSLDRATDSVVTLCFLLVFLIGAYCVYDSWVVFYKASDDSVLAYKPGYENDKNKPEKGVLDSMVAWLEVEGTSIDYPVMQGVDNSEFLNKDPFGQYSLSGSIFLDSRCDPSFEDPYSLVYGHHMERGYLFGALDDYLEEGWLEGHHAAKLTTDEEEIEVDLFATFEADATDERVFAPTEVDDEVLEYAIDNAVHLREEAIPDDGAQLVALSTCKYPDSSERTVVIGKVTSRTPVEEPETDAASETETP